MVHEKFTVKLDGVEIKLSLQVSSSLATACDGIRAACRARPRQPPARRAEAPLGPRRLFRDHAWLRPSDLQACLNRLMCAIPT